jgi:hypothetical protein
MCRREQKPYSRISRRLKPRVTVLAKASSNLTELIVRYSTTSKDVKLLVTEAEGATVLEAVTRRPVKTQQTEKIYCVL